MSDQIASTTPAKEKPAPIAFISYSHDTRDHKAWVASFAQRLVDKGVDVLFDQWDLSPGDDVPKFMEQAVSRADRVLMICTEAYIRKADDGKGGVGYEAMVVTGELVRDLGTNKFIPIVRQSNSPKSLPRCVGTRLYVDFSDEGASDEAFDQLLRELHSAPRLSKPPLGLNPFALPHDKSPAQKVMQAYRRLEFSEALASPAAAYERALAIIHEDDRVAWRKLILAATDQSSERFTRWKLECPDIPPVPNKDWSAVYSHALQGVECYASLIACLVAAAETGKPGFADQLTWVESILDSSKTGTSRTAYHAAFPQLLFYVTQALVGGMLMLGGSGDAAIGLATTKLQDSYNAREARPLFEMTRLNGWPDSLAHECTTAWSFLELVIDSWPWLKTAFGNLNECRCGITAYYHLLSFLNFIKLSSDDRLDEDERQTHKFPVCVPLCFCRWPVEVGDKGYKFFLRQTPLLKRLLEANKIAEADLPPKWLKWRGKAGAWLGDVYRNFWPQVYVPHSNLPDDLKGASLQLK